MQIEAIAKQIQWERSSKPRRVRLTPTIRAPTEAAQHLQ